MSADIIALSDQARVDEAWEAFRAHSARAQKDLSLMLDREYVQESIRLHNRFTRLFKMQEGL